MCLSVASLNSAAATSNDSGLLKNSVTLLGAGTFANSDFYAQANHRHLFLFGVSYRRALVRNNVIEFSYTPSIVPFAALFQPRLNSTVLTSSPQTTTQLHNGYGVGASPVGFEISFLPRWRIQPFLRSTGGFLYFNTPVPSPAAAQFNFTADGALGFRVILQNAQALNFAYVFHHFSNAFQAQDNPGVDSQMLYFGYTFSLGQSR